MEWRGDGVVDEEEEESGLENGDFRSELAFFICCDGEVRAFLVFFCGTGGKQLARALMAASRTILAFSHVINKNKQI